ncbi:MAG: hypothetical protein ACJ0QH_05785 [Flavobacteriales bacterium]
MTISMVIYLHTSLYFKNHFQNGQSYCTSRVETKDFEFLNAYPIPTSGPLKESLPSIGRYQYAIYTIDGKYLKGSSYNGNTDYIE